MHTSSISAFVSHRLRFVLVSLGAVLFATQLTGCITTAVILANKYIETLPPACSSLSSVERALTERCGGYKVGALDAKDVNLRVLSACPLTNFAGDPALWHGLPELLAKGASPEQCAKAPLLAMAEKTPCPAFSQMHAETREAVRWLAVADAASLSGPVLHMLTCPEAVNTGLSNVVLQWVAHADLDPDRASFSVLSSIHPASLSHAWVNGMLAKGHQALRAVEMDASGFERALAQGDVSTLDWWVQKAPALAHRAPAKGMGHVPWLPLARTMGPGFAVDDAARLRTAHYLIAHGASMNASLPHERGQSVGDYARSVQPHMWPALQALWQRHQAEKQTVALNTARSNQLLAAGLTHGDLRPRLKVAQAAVE
jgi:hypothetical protein